MSERVTMLEVESGEVEMANRIAKEVVEKVDINCQELIQQWDIKHIHMYSTENLYTHEDDTY